MPVINNDRLEVIYLEKREFKAKNGNDVVELLILPLGSSIIHKNLSLENFNEMIFPEPYNGKENSNTIILLLKDVGLNKTIVGWEEGSKLELEA